MGAGKIVQIVAVLAAIVAALWADMPQAGVIIAVLGVAAAWFVAEEDRQRILVTAIALSIVSGGLDAIPAVGGYIGAIMGSLASLYAAGAIAVILITLYEKLKP